MLSRKDSWAKQPCDAGVKECYGLNRAAREGLTQKVTFEWRGRSSVVSEDERP